MDRFNLPLRRVGTALAYGLVGLVGTAAVALGLLPITRAVQPLIYHAVYLQVGPSEATETAILAHFLAVGLLAISAPMVVGDYLSDRLAHRRALGVAIAAMAGLLLAFLAVALAGLAAFLTTLVVLAAAVTVVPLLLRFRYGVRSGGVPAFVGGIPVLILLVLLVGFGLGWGWGYVVTAQEVPDGTAGEPVATFQDAPALERDLFAASNCETTAQGRRVCYLSLRGYEHERTAARFMAERGVRCPYQNDPTGPTEGFLARHGDAHYRISCHPHGD